MRIVIETFIAAPRERVFDLARDVGAHARSAAFSGERILGPGRTEGLLELGDLVTFEGTHFAIRQRFTVRIIEFDPPVRFVDELARSAFRSMRHVHEFEAREGGTLMRDTLEWVSPFGVLGRAVDAIAVAPYLRRFVRRKQEALRHIAESEA